MPTTYMIFEGDPDSPGFYADYNAAAEPIGPARFTGTGAAEGFIISGSTMYRPSPYDPGLRLGPAGTNYFVDGGQYGFQIVAGRSASLINRGTSLNREYGLAGTVNLTAADGSTYTEDLSFVKLGKTGTRWAWFQQEGGLRSMHQVPANRLLSELQAEYPGITGFANAKEVVARALTGRFFQLAKSENDEDRRLFDDLMRALGMSREQFEEEGSGSVDPFVEANMDNFSSAVRVSYGPTGELKIPER